MELPGRSFFIGFCWLSLFFPDGKQQSWSRSQSRVDVTTRNHDAGSYEHASHCHLRFGHLPCDGTYILSGVTLWLSYVGAWFWFFYVCVSLVLSFWEFRWGFFCCLLFSSKISTLSPPPPQITSLSHNALPHTPSRISSKSFSKIQESPASTSSSFLTRAKHDPGDKVDNGCSRLVWVQLSKEVADVVCGAPLLPGHEAKEPGWEESNRFSKVCQCCSSKEHHQRFPAWSGPPSCL